LRIPGIGLRVVALPHDLFIARPLALLHHSSAEPPGKGMEPEQSFYDHVQRCGEIVTPPDMA